MQCILTRATPGFAASICYKIKMGPGTKAKIVRDGQNYDCSIIAYRQSITSVRVKYLNVLVQCEARSYTGDSKVCVPMSAPTCKCGCHEFVNE